MNIHELVYFIATLIPIAVFYWAISWSMNHYAQKSFKIRYRTRKDPLWVSLYIHIALVAVGAILVAFPFILLVMFKPL